MTWFKNLRTMTKLMLGFGCLALLMGVVGYEGVSGMSAIDAMLAGMYQQDMLGISAIKDVDTMVAKIGRQTRGAVIDDPALQDQVMQKVDAMWVQADEAMSRCERTFVTEQDRAALAKLKEALPEYRSLCADTIRTSMSGNKAGALAILKRAAAFGDKVQAVSKEVSTAKENSGKKAFEDSARTYERARTIMLGVLFGALVLAMGLGYFIADLIAKPLRQTVGVLDAVAAGDLTRAIDVETRDEVGQMAQALNAAVDGMREALVEVRASAGSLASSSQQLASASEQLSSGAQEQASSLEETSASLEEITSSVKQNADNAKQANQLAAAARDTAEKGGQVVSSAVSAMGEINTASKKIADIITAIDEIAFQTNLLALNAAVEAARAGEQGRGFAVVAAEVRTLAQRSATAAKEIKALIQDSVRKVEAGSQMVNQSGAVLIEIVASVKRVTDIVGEIAAASLEQSSGIAQVAKATAQVDQVTQHNAAQTEELSATAQTMSGSAEQLIALVERFRLHEERGGRHGAKAPSAPAKTASKEFARGLRNLSRKVSPEKETAARPEHQDTSTFSEFSAVEK